MNQTEFRCVHKQKENCHYNRIPLKLKRNQKKFSLSVTRDVSLGQLLAWSSYFFLSSSKLLRLQFDFSHLSKSILYPLTMQDFFLIKYQYQIWNKVPICDLKLTNHQKFLNSIQNEWNSHQVTRLHGKATKYIYVLICL